MRSFLSVNLIVLRAATTFLLILLLLPLSSSCFFFVFFFFWFSSSNTFTAFIALNLNQLAPTFIEDNHLLSLKIKYVRSTTSVKVRLLWKDKSLTYNGMDSLHIRVPLLNRIDGRCEMYGEEWIVTRYIPYEKLFKIDDRDKDDFFFVN